MITTALLNMKGGVGKTTLAVNLAHACYKRGERVLLVDLDPQFNATQHLMTYDRYEAHKKANGTVADILLDYQTNRMPITGRAAAPRDPMSLVYKLASFRHGCLFLLPSQLELARAIKNPQGVEFRLQKYLDQIETHFDRVFIDCAPTETVLTASALMSAHNVLVPIKPDRFSILGYGMVQQIINDFRKDYPDPKKVADLGVVFTIVASNSDRIERACKDAVRKQAPYTFATEIKFSRSYLRAVHEQKPLGLTSYARWITRATIDALEREVAQRIADIAKGPRRKK